MKKGARRALGIGLCALAAGTVAAGAFLLNTGAEPQSATVSTGLQYLADRAYLASSAPAGEEIVFDGELLDRALQGGQLCALTVTRLPDSLAGTLLLGYGEVRVGQRITRENLSYLRFVPGEGEAEFCFVPETAEGVAGYELRCVLGVTDGVNCCPSGKRAVTAVATHEGLCLEGELEASDPEGDALVFEVVSYPRNGTLQLDAQSGRFRYMPQAGFSGEDSFCWRVQDANGAFSEQAEVQLNVRALETGYLFQDIEASGMHSAALLMAERGLMGGEVLGGKHYFHPQRTLTRAAFVAILMQAAQIECPAAESTGYTDDADIPAPMKGAIKYAREQGWLGEDTVFRPADPITRAEAASIAARALGLSAPGYSEAVKDHNTIPVSVVDALYCAYEGGYIATMADGTLSPASTLTRGEAAVFFERVIEAK